MSTYDCQDTGESRPDRRQYSRAPGQDAIERMHWGFRTMFENLADDPYKQGFIKSMHEEFIRLSRESTRELPIGWKALPLEPTLEQCNAMPSLAEVNHEDQKPGWTPRVIQMKKRLIEAIKAAPSLPERLV